MQNRLLAGNVTIERLFPLFLVARHIPAWATIPCDYIAFLEPLLGVNFHNLAQWNRENRLQKQGQEAWTSEHTCCRDAVVIKE